MSESKKSFKKAEGAEDLRNKRHAHVVDLAKQRRRKLVMVKRLRDDEGASEAVVMSKEEFNAILERCKKSNPNSPSEDLKMIRKALSLEENEELGDVFVQKDGVLLVTIFLQSVCAENQVEAAWCITNVATCSGRLTEAVSATIPYLIPLLSVENTELQEQCCWALGNMAGDGVALRDLIVLGGGLPPIARLLASKDSTTARVAAWCTCNLIAGPSPNLQLVFSLGIPQQLASLLQTYPLTLDDSSNSNNNNNKIIIETVWCFSYMTAHELQFVESILSLGIVPVFISYLSNEAADFQIRIPSLRIIGNIAGCERPLSDSLLVHQAELLPTLRSLLSSPHRGVQKEAAWVAKNIAAGGIDLGQLLISFGFLDTFVSLLGQIGFDVWKQLAPLGIFFAKCGHLSRLVQSGALSHYINLIKSGDLDAAHAGIVFVELVLRSGREGVQMVEAANGIEALEMHSMSPLSQYANGLVDEFFGEDYGAEEEEEEEDEEEGGGGGMKDDDDELPPWRRRQ